MNTKAAISELNKYLDVVKEKGSLPKSDFGDMVVLCAALGIELAERLDKRESLSARQRMCDCEYLGICSDDPAKGDYCPLRGLIPKNPDVFCSFCGEAHELRNLHVKGKVSICRECVREINKLEGS